MQRLHVAIMILMLGSLTPDTAKAVELAPPKKPAAKAKTPTSSKLQKPFEDLWIAGKWSEAEKLVEDAYKTEPGEPKALIESLLNSGSDSVRPLAAGLFARHATVAELGDRAWHLSRTAYPDERRLLVRAIGTRARAAVVAKNTEARDEAFDAAAKFVDDTDLVVSAAAILSLADTGRVDAIGLFINKLVDVPANTSTPPEGDREILSRATMGAIRTLSGQHPQTIGEAKTWWNQIKPIAKTDYKMLEHTDHLSSKYGGQTYYIYDRFNLFYQLGNTQEPPAGGGLSLGSISPLLDRAPQIAEDVMTPIVGKPHIPVMRLYLCDPQQFNAMGGNNNFDGQTSGNEVQLRVENLQSLPGTLWHEYIHVIHSSNFVYQPRWLSEGLAMSFTVSAKGSKKLAGLADDPDVVQILERGGFSEMVNWNSSGSTDSREAARYHTARICIDYLRFGGFGAENERLAFLMGRISRRQSAKASLEGVYGHSIKDLDAGLRDWLVGK